MNNYITDVIATFGAVFAYYDSPLFEKIRNYLNLTKLQVFLIFALIFTALSTVGLHNFNLLIAISSSVLIVNAIVTRLRQIRR